MRPMPAIQFRKFAWPLCFVGLATLFGRALPYDTEFGYALVQGFRPYGIIVGYDFCTEPVRENPSGGTVAGYIFGGLGGVLSLIITSYFIGKYSSAVRIWSKSELPISFKEAVITEERNLAREPTFGLLITIISLIMFSITSIPKIFN